VNCLLDTNVISEWTKPRPDAGLVEWLATVDEDRLFISVVTLAELRFGVERMDKGARRNRLDSWLIDELPERFEDRVVFVTPDLADVWGRMMARGQSIGRPVGSRDALIAATAEQLQFTLVTRNVSDFEALDIPLLHPWQVP
jgi:predicted nucleic acid-binding protein